MPIDLTSLLAGVSLTAVAGWIGSFFALRKGEREVQIKQITEERTKWREVIRKLCDEIVVAYELSQGTIEKSLVFSMRARLLTSLNPKDVHDNEIVRHYDRLFSHETKDIDVFMLRVALLLKHDWERVKWECTPIYIKPFQFIFCYRFCLPWQRQNYRNVAGGQLVMSENDRKNAHESRILRVVVATLALAALAIVGGIFVYYLALDIAYAQPWMMEAFKEHTAAVLGLPLAAIAAFALVLVLETKSGRIEFEAIGFKFRGASGEIIMWVVCFMAIVLSIRVLW